MKLPVLIFHEMVAKEIRLKPEIRVNKTVNKLCIRYPY